MAAPTLQDLTKDELIEIIGKYVFTIPTGEIAWMIYQRRNKAALLKMKKASADADKLAGGKTLKANQEWFAAHDKWDKAADELKKNGAWYDRVKAEIEGER